jgi:hypothetical protein
MKTEKKIWNKAVVCLSVFAFLATAGFCFLNVHSSSAEVFVSGVTSPVFVPVANSDSDVCSFRQWASSDFLSCTLLVVLRLMGFLLSLSATLFSWMINPVNMMSLIDNPIIYASWAMIRDVLNIGFILVLLFSAFATVFQMSSYNYKNILRNVVLMALLVNFSYPISRFIIDLSNSMMYYFVNAFSLGELSLNPFADIANSSGVAHIINSGSGSSDSTYLLAAIIFVFILAITFLVIAVLFVVRTVALALLIVFSSVAFVGVAIPSLSGKASAWWDNLFKYAFFGPIMIFMLYIAMEMMRYASTVGMGNMQQIAQGQANDPNFIAAMAFFAIPIVILWFGLGVAQSMSIAGASAVTGKGRDAIRWAGRNVGGVRPVASWGFKKSGVPGGVKKRYEASWLGTDATKERQERWDDRVYRKLGGKVDYEKDMKKKAEEYKKEDENEISLKDKVKNGDLGAAYRLALDGKMDEASLGNVMKKLNTIENVETRNRLIEDFENKTKEKNIDVLINYKIATTEGARDNHDMKVSIAKEYLKSLDPDKWRNQDISKIVDDEAMMYAASETYNKMSENNQRKVTENMKGNKYEAGKDSIW